MKKFFTEFSTKRIPDSRLNFSVAIGSTIIRQVMASGLYFIATWIITRQLGPQQNGVLTTVLLLPQTLYAFFNLGLGPSNVYHLSNGYGSLIKMRHTNWILALLLWIIVFFLLIINDDVIITKYFHGIKKYTAIYSSLLFPMMLLAAWSSSLIQGYRDYQAYNRTLIIQPFTFCSIIIFLFLINSITVLSVLSCYIISQMCLWMLSEKKISKFQMRTENKNHKFIDAINFGLKIHISNIITFVNYRLALYLVSYMLGATITGKYALSVQLAEVLWLVSNAASMIIFPESAVPNKTPAELQKIIMKIADTVLQITLLGALIAAACAPFAIPWIFGIDYQGSVIPFMILLPGIVAWSYMSIISNSLAGMGYQKINIRTAVLCFSINIILDILFIPKFGSNGAALASTLAFSITTIYTVVLYRKIMNEKIKLCLS